MRRFIGIILNAKYRV
ncbi:hypothetical protein ITQ84_09660 [Pediococcus pentosaceus]|nr:hypothetical protein [Pediococcus pentosaceus]